MEDDDEVVVFQNSSLYQHLRETGYSEEDVSASAHASGTRSQKNPPDSSTDNSGKDGHAPKNKSLLNGVKSTLERAFWDDNWTEEIVQLHHKHADELTEQVMDLPLLEDEDASYIDSFATSMQTYRNIPQQEDSIVTHIMMQSGVLGISMAYGCFRMLYLNTMDPTAKYFVWSLDVFAVLITIATLMPSTLKMTSMGKVVRRLKDFNETTVNTLAELQQFHRLTKKSLRLVQERELISKGFTLANSVTPITRLEYDDSIQRQCPQLRLRVFHMCRGLMLEIKDVTRQILSKFPAHVEVEGLGNYLANLPLEEYGQYAQYVTLQGPDCEAELRVATENYCLRSLKAMAALWSIHASEFMRVLVMSCLVKADDVNNSGFVEQHESVQQLHKGLKSKFTPLAQCYTFHMYLSRDRSEENQRRRNDGPRQQTPVSSAYVAAHSLSLHLQAAIKRVQDIEEELNKFCEQEETEDIQVSLPSDISSHINTNFKIVKFDLDACKDCWDEGDVRLTKLVNQLQDESADKDVLMPYPPSEKEPSSVQPITIIGLGEPIIEDQVFEAYTDSGEMDDLPQGDDDFLLTEEKEKKKQEKRESVRVLTELKSVISVRAIEREERERKALLRQNPHLAESLDALSREHTNASSEGPSVVPQCENIGELNHCSLKQNCKSENKCVPESDRNRQTESDHYLDEDESQSVPVSGINTESDHNLDDGESQSVPDSDLETRQVPRFQFNFSSSLSFTANLGSMAAARSRDMERLPEDTFGDSIDDSEEEEEIEDRDL